MPKTTRTNGRRSIGVLTAATATIAGFGLSTTVSASTAPGGDYCAAHLAAEEAFAMGDPAMIEPASAALVAAAPPEIADAVDALLAAAQTGPTSPEFAAAYNEVMAHVSANCGFGAVDVVLSEYSFGGIPAEVPAGPTVFTITNTGEEVHEMVLFRRNDGVDTPVEELLMLSDAEIEAAVTFASAGLAMPGETSYVVADLAPGIYIALCFLPVGATPEVFEQMMSEGMGEPSSSSTPPPPADSSTPTGSMPMGEGSIHAMEGMIMEFTVVE